MNENEQNNQYDQQFWNNFRNDIAPTLSRNELIDLIIALGLKVSNHQESKPSGGESDGE